MATTEQDITDLRALPVAGPKWVGRYVRTTYKGPPTYAPWQKGPYTRVSLCIATEEGWEWVWCPGKP